MKSNRTFEINSVLFGPDVPKDYEEVTNALMPEMAQRIEAILDSFPDTLIGRRSRHLAMTLHAIKQTLPILNGPEEARDRLATEIANLTRMVRNVDPEMVMNKLQELFAVTVDINTRLNEELRLRGATSHPEAAAAIEKAGATK